MALAIRKCLGLYTSVRIHYLTGSACPAQPPNFPVDRKSAEELFQIEMVQNNHEKINGKVKTVISVQSCLSHTNVSPCGHNSPSTNAMLYTTLTDCRPPVLHTLNSLIAMGSTCGSCSKLNNMDKFFDNFLHED